MKTFKVFRALGDEARTDSYWSDAAGKNWPIYSKLIDFGAGPNATGKAVAHGVSLNLEGFVKVNHAQFVKAATAPVVLDGAALIATVDATNVTLTATANLTTYTGWAELLFTKSTD